MKKLKQYGLYNIANYEQCEYFGSKKEIAEYLNLKENTIAVCMVRKRKGMRALLLNKYELVEWSEKDK